MESSLRREQFVINRRECHWLLCWVSYHCNPAVDGVYNVGAWNTKGASLNGVDRSKDQANAFTIDMGGGQEIQDKRPISRKDADNISGEVQLTDGSIDPALKKENGLFPADWNASSPDNSSKESQLTGGSIDPTLRTSERDRSTDGLNRILEGKVQEDTSDAERPPTNFQEWKEHLNRFARTRFATTTLDNQAIQIADSLEGYKGRVVSLTGSGQDQVLVKDEQGHVIGTKPNERPVHIDLPEQVIPIQPGDSVRVEGNIIETTTHQKIPYRLTITRSPGGHIYAEGEYTNERGDKIHVKVGGADSRIPFEPGQQQVPAESDPSSGF
jgi:hypothetical protein